MGQARKVFGEPQVDQAISFDYAMDDAKLTAEAADAGAEVAVATPGGAAAFVATYTTTNGGRFLIASGATGPMAVAARVLLAAL